VFDFGWTGYKPLMSAWEVLVVPAALGSVAVLLALTAWLERRVLSPRALILSAARARRGSAGHVEALVAEQCDRLLDRADRAS
jgi:hypothetical protein